MIMDCEQVTSWPTNPLPPTCCATPQSACTSTYIYIYIYITSSIYKFTHHCVKPNWMAVEGLPSDAAMLVEAGVKVMPDNAFGAVETPSRWYAECCCSGTRFCPR